MGKAGKKRLHGLEKEEIINSTDGKGEKFDFENAQRKKNHR